MVTPRESRWHRGTRQAVGFPRSSATGSQLVAAMFPLPPKRDPEGGDDQPEIQQKALPPDVEKIVSELVPPGDVAVRVDLRDPRQPGRDPMTGLVSGDLVEGDDVPRPADFDLLGHQRPRADEAHVAP